MQVIITINTDNAAFENEPLGPETARILEQLAEHMRTLGSSERGLLRERSLRDINGNVVGTAKVKGT